MCDENIKTVHHIYQRYALVLLPSLDCLRTLDNDDEVVVLPLVMDVRDSAVRTSHGDRNSRIEWRNIFRDARLIWLVERAMTLLLI
jgi:hypothetical protein